ncbi:unnamed protein product [Schistocephalus solidus]|uniref:DUF3398 domain-containing protein n=1 Tax=Schistocephalus solidus TaxID=70667 RepID=A0A183T9M7_SCHSO|nr:unnamed protein product [Schistocephalus solidus]
MALPFRGIRARLVVRPGRLRPRLPPASSPNSGLLDYVTTPGSGGEEEERVRWESRCRIRQLGRIKMPLPDTFDILDRVQITCVSEPLDYEQYLVRNKASILNDPHRDLIIFPQDELMIAKFQVLPLKRNTIHPSGCLPASSTLAELSAKSALARQVSADLTSNEWPFLYQPQLIYRGNFSVVPRDRLESLFSSYS